MWKRGPTVASLSPEGKRIKATRSVLKDLCYNIQSELCIVVVTIQRFKCVKKVSDLFDYFKKYMIRKSKKIAFQRYQNLFCTLKTRKVMNLFLNKKFMQITDCTHTAHIHSTHT